MNLGSYENYTKSKTYLLDEIPSHWEIIPMNHFINLVTDYVANGSFASLRENVEYKNEEDYAILVRLADNTNNFSGPYVYIDKEAYNFLSKSKLYEGDIVLSNTGSIGSIFKVPNLGKPMSLAPNCLLIRFENQTFANYFFYLFSCDIGMKFLESITTVTTQPKFNKTDFKKLPMLKPPVNEQNKIISYLDGHTSRIDEIIIKNEKLISLLEEKRISLINHVVSKGLDPNVEMKYIDLKWSEYIPKHWVETKLKHVANKVSKRAKKDAEMLVCSNSGKVILKKDTKTGLVTEKEEKLQKVEKGDLLIHGMDTWHGAIAISDYDGKCTPVVHVCKSNEENRYLKYYLQSLAFKKVYKTISNGIRENTSDFRSWEKAGSIPIVLPPIKEQIEISNYLDNELNKIESLTNKLNVNIELLEEYKTSLIHHVVTGKIKVDEV